MENLRDIIAEIKASDFGWALQCLVVLALTAVFSYYLGRLLRKFARKIPSLDSRPGLKAFFEAAPGPLQALIWISGLTFTIEVALSELKLSMVSAVMPVRTIALIAVISWFAMRFVHKFGGNFVQHHVSQGKTVDLGAVDFAEKLLSVLVIASGVLVVLPTLGFSISGLLAFGGLGGIAIGFAAKDMLANFFGTLMIYFDRPFIVGDWVNLPEKGIEGTVEKITWRQIIIRSFDKRQVFIPNSMFSSVIIENPSRMTHRRFKEHIGVRFEDMSKVEGIVSGIKEMLEKMPDIDNEAGIVVSLDRFAAYSVDILVSAFTRQLNYADYCSLRQRILLAIAGVVQGSGAEFAFPTQVSINQGLGAWGQGSV